MAKNKKGGGFIDRLIMGKEKSEGYARASLPSNRWELFWDIFKGRFWKLVLINLIVLLTFLPVLFLLFFRLMDLVGQGSTYPFAQVFGVGYQSPFALQGYAEQITLFSDIRVLMLLPVAALVAAVGLAGGAYVMRNVVWTEGVFVSNDFWQGVKANYKQVVVVSLLFSVVTFFSAVSNDLADYAIATEAGSKWIFIVCKVVNVAIMAFYTMMSLHMLTMCVTYDLKFRQLFKNSALFTIGMLPQNVFFIFLGIIPFLLIWIGSGTIIMYIGIIIALLFGFSLFLLVWTDFCHWSYDRYVNDKIGAKKNRGIYERVKENDEEAVRKYREQLLLSDSAVLGTKPIKPITDDELQLAELPTSFSRDDIIKLNQSRQALYDDNEQYVSEHSEEFKQLDEERALLKAKDEEEKRKRIEKAQKELNKRKK